MLYSRGNSSFVHTWLTHPEHGKYVRFLKGALLLPRLDGRHNSGENKISAYDAVSYARSKCGCSLQRWQSVPDDFGLNASETPGSQAIQSILSPTNPITLRSFCLDMVQNREIGEPHDSDMVEDGRIKSLGVISGLTTTVGCTALSGLILFRIGESSEMAMGAADE